MLVLGLIAGGLIANRPPMMDPPGLWTRLVTYLGTHVAEIRPDHPFPELRPRFYALPPDRLYAVTREAIAGLGWGIASEDPTGICLTAVVESALWRFKDDVVACVEPAEGGSTLRMRSSSRIGRGDLAANTRHLLDLYAAIEQRLAATTAR
ncbi:MAG: DUF1499 domain-containing protein [Pseudomonadota bacterium]|nr:DUF1499 domain-containing protein [Gammaproteobacteria bacterium]MDQ3581989.1 DUF1499 domain-containing protein [Pseudomonadota bacterium]